MQEGTSVGLFIVLSIVIFGLLVVVVTTVILPSSSKGLGVIQDGATKLLNSREKVAPRTLG